MAGNLAGKTRIPKRSERLWRCLLAHNPNHFGPRDEAGIGKSLQNCSDAKEMIAVAMGGVDRRQILSAFRNPIRQGTRLLYGNRGIDEDSVSLPKNKSGRNRRPRPPLFAGRQIACASGSTGRSAQLPPQGPFFSCMLGFGGSAAGVSSHVT